MVLMQAGLRGVVQVCVSELCSRSGQKWKVRMCLLVGRMSRDVVKFPPRLSNLARRRGVESACGCTRIGTPALGKWQLRSTSLAPEKLARRICRISATQHQTQSSRADHKLVAPLPHVVLLLLVLW